MLDLNESNFAQETSLGLVLVDFYTVWCGPCRVVAPILEQLENVTIGKVDVEDNRELAVRFKVNVVPTLVLLKDGIEVDRLTGVHSKEVLQGKIDKLQ